VRLDSLLAKLDKSELTCEGGQLGHAREPRCGVSHGLLVATVECSLVRRAQESGKPDICDCQLVSDNPEAVSKTAIQGTDVVLQKLDSFIVFILAAFSDAEGHVENGARVWLHLLLAKVDPLINLSLLESTGTKQVLLGGKSCQELDNCNAFEESALLRLEKRQSSSDILLLVGFVVEESVVNVDKLKRLASKVGDSLDELSVDVGLGEDVQFLEAKEG